MNPYAPPLVIESAAVTRTEFIRKTYAHLAGAVGLFALICTLIMSSPLKLTIASMMTGKAAWIILMVLFMVVGWVASRWAASETSKGLQYAGLILYTVFQAIIFTPMLIVAQMFAVAKGGAANAIIYQAAFATIGLVAGLTVIALTTKKDFSFLDGFLKIAFFVALGLIVASIIWGFSLGIWFSAIMILLAGGSLLRNTSNLLHVYSPHQYVAASLALFADVALMFWYVLRILIQLASSD